MQLMIDIAVESAATLRLAAQFLFDHAAMLEGAQTPAAPTAPVAPPAPSNVVPFPPPPPVVVPQAPATSIPSASTMAAPVSPTAAAGALPATSVPAPPAPVATAPGVPPAPTTGGPVERDSAGVPWDARIHQKGKSKKKDQTWKLQKGIDSAIVEGVMQDLRARGLLIQTPAAVGASAPVSLPPVPPPPFASGEGYSPQGAHAPAASGIETQAYPAQGQAQTVNLPPVPMPLAAPVGVSDPTNAGVLPGGEVVDPFRSLVQKFTTAREKGILTAAQVNAIVTESGAPSLQALKAMAHLIPVADAKLDAALLLA